MKTKDYEYLNNQLNIKKYKLEENKKKFIINYLIEFEYNLNLNKIINHKQTNISEIILQNTFEISHNSYDLLHSINQKYKKKCLYIYKKLIIKKFDIFMFFISLKKNLINFSKNCIYFNFDLIKLEILIKKNKIKEFWYEMFINIVKNF